MDGPVASEKFQRKESLHLPEEPRMNSPAQVFWEMRAEFVHGMGKLQQYL